MINADRTIKSKALLADCANCPLADRPFVSSLIKPDATLILLGEAPGYNEAYQGKPFVGQSGKLIDQTLAHVGADPRNVSKLNVVCCHPVANEQPDQRAIKACSQRLEYELGLINTQAPIAALGNTAIEALDRLAGTVGTVGIMKRRGSWYTYGSRNYLAMLHPAFVLRSAGYMPMFLADMQTVTSGIKPTYDTNAVKYTRLTATNKDRVLRYLRAIPDNAIVSFDTETDDLAWHATRDRTAAKLLKIGICYEPKKVIIIAANECSLDVVSELETLFDRVQPLAHNGKYDQHVLFERLGVIVELSHDTMLAHHILNETGKHGLKELAREFLHMPDYEGDLIDRWFDDNKIKKDDRKYGLLPDDLIDQYLAIDCTATLELWSILQQELASTNLYDQPYLLQMQIANMVFKVETHGIKLDVDYLEQVKSILDAEKVELADQLDIMVRTDLAKPLKRQLLTDQDDQLFARNELIRLMQPKRKKDHARFNPSSPKQVSLYLYDILQLKLTKRLIKPTGTNTGVEALDALPPHPFVDLLREYRRIAKMTDTYLPSLLGRVDPDHFLHVDFKLTGTETGRLSAHNGDHGIPRPEPKEIPANKRYGAMIRSSFMADDQRSVLIDADYSQLELVIYAHLSQEPFLLNAYRNGLDVHDQTARMLEQLGTPFFRGYVEGSDSFKKDRRVVAKNTNFGNIYQGGAQGIVAMLGGKVDVATMQMVLGYYRELMPVAAQFNLEQFRRLKELGYVETIFGQRRRFMLLTDDNIDEARKAAVNMPVQGSGGMLNNLAAVELVKRGMWVAHLNHDNIITRAKAYQADRQRLEVEQTMIAVAAKYITSVPIKVDVKIVDRWCDQPILGDDSNLQEVIAVGS